ncbi:hypothetical protein FRZ03_33030 [Streptomyces misionensis]|uniref:Transmembrane protein n=1 Tax=Streptomyces misionensis TaxID=67331 RepID=A0A5C6IV98_9ACTN|nr:hypothetical protein [Streptomyces misionensis]TWV32523.1 hypothetical protein FRZ03_33030 [Streptomyces misionensis]
MHMNSLPQHLRSEDRQEFERLLDEVLRSAPHRAELAAAGQRLSPAQLRTMAIDASALITSAAADEYAHYVRIRDALRRPEPPAPTATDDSGPTGTDPAAGPHGAGAVAVVAVLAPLLSATAAAIFLLIGYILRSLDSGQPLAGTMLTAGWVFGALTVAALLVAAAGLLLTALRNGTSPESRARDAAAEEVAGARAAWQDALLERGILPFLREALGEPGPTAPHRTAAPRDRMPRLGYDRPGFSSPGDGVRTDRPRFTSPDYTSPDYGGPEHQPD